jgi:hypothetical protein
MNGFSLSARFAARGILKGSSRVGADGNSGRYSGHAAAIKKAALGCPFLSAHARLPEHYAFLA